LRKEVDIEFRVTSEGFGEELSPGLMTVREALVNMLMHSDYFAPSHPRIRVFNNHIEYYNPGGLPKPLNDLKGNDLSIPRNPILAKLFRMVKLAENAGYGFDKMDHNWKMYTQTDPEYSIAFDSTIVKLITQTVDSTKTDKIPEIDLQISEQSRKDVGKISERIREEFGKVSEATFLLISEDPYITTEVIAEKVGKTSRTIERALEKLKVEQIVERKGPNLGGYWKIKI
jgi:ATP-dependent DNA helicase RecG